MAKSRFSSANFLMRLVLALILVFATYNPVDPWSYYHWALRPLLDSVTEFTIAKALIGVVLIIAWGVFLGATFKSLGMIGTVLIAVVFGLCLWLIIDAGWVSLDQSTVLNWLVLFAISGILAVGVSWSHLRRRLTGQVDIEDSDD